MTAGEIIADAMATPADSGNERLLLAIIRAATGFDYQRLPKFEMALAIERLELAGLLPEDDE